MIQLAKLSLLVRPEVLPAPARNEFRNYAVVFSDPVAVDMLDRLLTGRLLQAIENNDLLRVRTDLLRLVEIWRNQTGILLLRADDWALLKSWVTYFYMVQRTHQLSLISDFSPDQCRDQLLSILNSINDSVRIIRIF